MYLFILAIMSKVMCIYVIFYHVHSPNIEMTHDPSCINFETFQLWPDSTLNNRASHEISSGSVLYFRSYQPKTSQGVEVNLPSAFRANYFYNEIAQSHNHNNTTRTSDNIFTVKL